ncbi:YoaK family protein [Aliiglaciecola sp. LCG003]|uniref:YoaK family protein n=1 Tax=Aliiglaciecola sp. LCG003 TaxID=3053655 RepID=UPI0025743BA4|nr:YoaK family protein [Aliiglaciecola sp. LCG003]WJG09421.1 YoaK family protein [Aliiglaciecola sp. LCG003]
MVSKLPRWVEYGAFILAFIAGNVNAIGLLGFQHQSVSHLSGTATLVGTGLMGASTSDVLHLIGVLISFLMGALVSGFILSSSSLKLGRHYDSLLAIEGLLLLMSYYLLSNGLPAGHYAASAACGLQNALATSYSGAIVRTTHVTGIFTDLGIMLGAKLRGELFDQRKGILFLLIIVGFIVGGTSGAVLFNSLQFFALVVPASICLVLAVSYRIYTRDKTN